MTDSCISTIIQNHHINHHINNNKYTEIEITKNQTITQILLFFYHLNDIIHLHIYSFILFVIFKNIENEYFNRFLKNFFIIIVSHILLMPMLEDCLLENSSNGLLRIFNSIKYIIILEFVAYWYHRLVHIKLFYNHIHSHEFIGSAYHYLLRTKYDILAQIVYIYLPLRFTPMVYHDFMCIYFIYIFIGFLSNRFILSNIHKDTRKYNYSIGLPIFDYFFGTYLSESRYLSLQQHNS